MRDGVFADQVVDPFGELAGGPDQGPWLTVASFVNPHDIAFSGFGWEQMLQFGPPDDTVPEFLNRLLSRIRSSVVRPVKRRSRRLWPQMIFQTATDLGYRRLYYYLLKLVDQAIGRILESLEASRHEGRDHRRVHLRSRRPVGAHGGLIQKWCNAFDEATQVPLHHRGSRHSSRWCWSPRADQPYRPGPDLARVGRYRQGAAAAEVAARLTRPIRCLVGT